jgi:hypothetical protein
MNAQDYADWSELSGLYLRNLSHVDRYDTYAKLISPAGLTTLIVADFLHENPDGQNVADWRTYSVYETGDERQPIMWSRRVEQHVGRLQIPMQDAAGMGQFQGIGQASDDPCRLGDLHWLPPGLLLFQPRRQRRARYVFRYQVTAGLIKAGFKDRDDIGMVELGCHPGFGFESGSHPLVVDHRPVRHFEGDLAAQHVVPGAKHRAAAAPPDDFADPKAIGWEPLSRCGVRAPSWRLAPRHRPFLPALPAGCQILRTPAQIGPPLLQIGQNFDSLLTAEAMVQMLAASVCLGRR